MQSILTGYGLKAEFEDKQSVNEGKLKSQATVKENMLAVTQPSRSIACQTAYLFTPPHMRFCFVLILYYMVHLPVVWHYFFFFLLSSTFSSFTQFHSVSPLTDASLDVKQKASLQKHNKAQRCQLQDFRVVTNLIHTATFLGYNDRAYVWFVSY